MENTITALLMNFRCDNRFLIKRNVAFINRLNNSHSGQTQSNDCFYNNKSIINNFDHTHRNNKYHITSREIDYFIVHGHLMTSCCT